MWPVLGGYMPFGAKLGRVSNSRPTVVRLRDPPPGMFLAASLSENELGSDTNNQILILNLLVTLTKLYSVAALFLYYI